MKRARVFLLLVLLVTCRLELRGEESEVKRFGAGRVKADFLGVLYLNGTPITDPGIVLAVMPNGTDYRWEGLPDATAGSGDSYSWVYELDGAAYTYRWPTETLTPESVSAGVNVQVTTSPIKIAAGATLPAAEVTVYGLQASPAGATATFLLYGRSGAVLTIAATCPTWEALSDGSWTLTCVHAWSVAETSGLAGDYTARFMITLPGGDVLGAPQSRDDLTVRVFR